LLRPLGHRVHLLGEEALGDLSARLWAQVVGSLGVRGFPLLVDLRVGHLAPMERVILEVQEYHQLVVLREERLSPWGRGGS